MYQFPAMPALFNINALEDEDLGRCRMARMLNNRLRLGASCYLLAHRKGRREFGRWIAVLHADLPSGLDVSSQFVPFVIFEEFLTACGPCGLPLILGCFSLAACTAGQDNI